MDMLILFMLFGSLTPFALWRHRKNWALLQLPFILGMWAQFAVELLDRPVGTFPHIVLAVLFYGNLLYTECAVVRFCIDVRRRQQQSAAQTAAVPTLD